MAGAHQAYKKDHKYHVSAGSYDGGACLIKHEGNYKESDSCSYRWQAVKRAGMAPGKSVYDSHSNNKAHIGGRGSSAFDPTARRSVEDSPGMGGQFITTAFGTQGRAKGKTFAIMEVTNFTTGQAPYGNQVHHVLDQGSLHGSIDDLTEIWEAIRWMIVCGLLSEKYNLNHFDNNLILPTRECDCLQTGLPKHYGGNHPAYSGQIKPAVVKALTPYEKIANQMKKNKAHDRPEPEKLKDALIRISKLVYNRTMALAKRDKAAARVRNIDDLPRAVFRGL